MTAVPATRPRPVLCVTEHEHRDRALADTVAAGRFPIHAEVRTLGLEPDWLGADLPEDAEWRIDWVKFGWGLDLADAAVATGEARYATAWERLAGSWIDQVAPDADPSEVTARRIGNWLYAWQRLPGVAPALADRLLTSIDAQARHVRRTLAPERNHRTLELYTLLLVALALPELDPDGDLRDLAVHELHRNLLADFRPDGVHREASTHYHAIALRSFVGACANARRHGVALPGGFAERVEAACAFALHCRRPDGTTPALSDADTGEYGPLLDLAAEVLGRPDLAAGRAAATAVRRDLAAGRAAATAVRRDLVAGRAGAPAVRRDLAASFPDGGYFVQRTGWDARARWLIFDCGPLGDGGHGHYDALSVEAAGLGRRLVVDPGRFTYAEGEPNLRHWFRGTAAHNTVSVDGLDQTPYARGRSRRPSARARLLGRGRAAGLDVLAGEVVSPCYDAVHRRRVVLVDGGYWLVADSLTSGRPHRYDLRWHLDADAQAATRLDADGLVLAPGLALAVAGAGRVALEPGWISPAYGIRHPAPVVSARVDAADALLVTLLAPLAAAGRRPRLAVTPLDAGAGACRVEVEGLEAGARDTLVLAGDEVRWTRATCGGAVLGAAVAAVAP